MASEIARDVSGLTRRALITRLVAAGFAAPAIASIVADGAWAQDAATPAAASFNSPFTIIPPNNDPAKSLESIGVKTPMIAHGGFNFGTPPDLVDGFDVANDVFYIRSHGPSARLDDPSKYRLTVGGLVDKPLTLTLDDLKGMPQRKFQAFLECSGNSRGFFSPMAKGGQWRNDAVGNAEWSGVPLHEVLNQAGVKDGAIDVVSQGGDFPEMQRGLPIATAMGADVLLALQMNGEDLPAPHGGPVRLFVPGWGGVASTKWIIDLTVVDHAFEGEFNTQNYVVIDEFGAVVRPVREMPVSSALWTPQPGAQLKTGTNKLTGYAWSGMGGVTRVEVSTDNGATWADAKITDNSAPHSWARFKHEWDAVPGPTGLLTRAHDDRTRSQPASTPWNQLGFQYDAVQRVLVTVAA